MTAIEQLRVTSSTDIALPISRISNFKGNVTDSTIVNAACEGVDVVYHTAALVDYWSRLPFQRQAIYNVNVIGTQVLSKLLQPMPLSLSLSLSLSLVAAPHELARRIVALERHQCLHQVWRQEAHPNEVRQSVECHNGAAPNHKHKHTARAAPRRPSSMTARTLRTSTRRSRWPPTP